MEAAQPIIRAWVRVSAALDDFMSSQDAVVELMQLAHTEAARLDSDEYIAQKLCESLGRADISGPASRSIFEAVAAFVEMTGAVRSARRANPPSDGQEQAADEVATDDMDPQSESGVIVQVEIADTLVSAGGAEADEDAQAESEALADEAAEAAVEAEVKALNDLLVSQGIPAEAVFRALTQYWRLERRGPRSALLLESLLISAVSQFETFVARVISESLYFSPQMLKESGRTFAFHEVTKHKNIEAFTEAAADDYADKLMREPMSKWLKFLNTSLRQDSMWVDDYLNEILQRRHIHVHAGGRVSALYIENTRNAGHLKIGKRMPVTAEYLHAALDRLAVVVLFISQASLFAIRESKLAKSLGFDAEDGKSNEVAFELLIEGRPGAVAEIFERVNPSIWTNSTREHVRANSWLAMKMLGRFDEVRADVEVWDVSLSERLSLAKACLLETPDAQGLLDRLMAAGEISVLDAAIWPLLEPLRRAQGLVAITAEADKPVPASTAGESLSG